MIKGILFILSIVISSKLVGAEYPVVEENILGKLEVYKVAGAKMVRLQNQSPTDVLFSISKDKTFFRFTTKNIHLTVQKINDGLYQVKNELTGDGRLIFNADDMTARTLGENLNILNNYQNFGWANNGYDFLLLEANEKSAFNVKIKSPTKTNAEMCEQSDCSVTDGVVLISGALAFGAACAETLGVACVATTGALAGIVNDFEADCGACIREQFDPPSFEERYPPRRTQPGTEHICEVFWPDCYVEREPTLPEGECNVVDINCDNEDPTDM